ncbi:MBL fold metallo-hydrolase [Azospirillum sp. 412522]|nr:MBL fold metallo-hydrolase [Azospirillum sp. 412522]MBY6262639.1 MBL fold metallo-hydrolase [Azospirillum sp. 412522]
MTTGHDAATYRVGSFNITRVTERLIEFPAASLLPDWQAERVGPHAGSLVPGSVGGDLARTAVSVHTWLVRADGITILVDTGIGNDKVRRQPVFNGLRLPYLERLAAAGVTPGMVDFVLMTHVHTDHVGWNTMLVDGRWVPTFPNARYLLPRAGYEYFTGPDGRGRHNYDMFADSVLPVIEAGKAEFVPDDGGEVLPGFTYIPTPGHSVDHMSIALASGGRHGLFAGDVMHHPAQIFEPAWNSVFCADTDRARASRRLVLDRVADQDALYFSSHFPDTSAGRIARGADGFEWRFE